MSRSPEISIVMPVYNDARHLPTAIESILTQTYGEFEFIIVDDHSTDSTAEILVRYALTDSRIRVIRNKENVGVARSLNRGCEVAGGRLIARMDSDDVSLPERFDRQVTYLNENPEVGVLGTQTVFIEEDGRLSQQPEWAKPTSHNDLLWSLLYSTPICHPSVMMRSDLLHNVGGYDPDYRNEDMKLWTEMAFVTKLGNLEDVLLQYRMPSARHLDRLSYWEPHIRRVSHGYAERLLGHEVDPTLIQTLIDSQLHSRAFEQNVTLAEVAPVCQMLEDILSAMRDRGLLELERVAALDKRLFQHIEGLISAAFQ